MFKYIKYEIKGTYKYILGVLALVLILTIALYSLVGNIITNPIARNMFVGLSMMILFGTALATFLYIVGSFRKELYEDRGYLTFTLPITGNQIVGAKLIVALFWILVILTSIAIYHFIAMLIYMTSFELSAFLKNIFTVEVMKRILVGIFMTILNMIQMLTIIYFSMALGRVTFKNKKIGGLWFIIFLILSWLISYGHLKVVELIPYYFDLNGFGVQNSDSMMYQMNMNPHGSFSFSLNIDSLITNIAGLIYDVIVTVGLFLGTSYLVEKKIDL